MTQRCRNKACSTLFANVKNVKYQYRKFSTVIVAIYYLQWSKLYANYYTFCKPSPLMLQNFSVQQEDCIPTTLILPLRKPESVRNCSGSTATKAKVISTLNLSSVCTQAFLKFYVHQNHHNTYKIQIPEPFNAKILPDR